MKIHPETRTVHLTREDCRALCAFASRDACSAHLHGVAFVPSEGAAFATDGNTLLLGVNGSTFDCPSFLVPLSDLERAAKNIPRRGTLAVSADGSDGSGGPRAATLVACDEQGVEVCRSTASAVDGSHLPPYRECIPAQPTPDDTLAHAWKVNPAFLARLALVTKAAGTKGIVASASRGELEPLLFACSGESTAWTAVIMPMRLT